MTFCLVFLMHVIDLICILAWFYFICIWLYDFALPYLLWLFAWLNLHCYIGFDYLLGLFVCNDFIWILFCILLMILFALLNHFVDISVLFISITCHVFSLSLHLFIFYFACIDMYHIFCLLCMYLELFSHTPILGLEFI